MFQIRLLRFGPHTNTPGLYSEKQSEQSVGSQTEETEHREITKKGKQGNLKKGAIAESHFNY